MKKLRLKALSLGAREILTREQLKSINGGCDDDFDCNPGDLCQGNTCVHDENDPGSSGNGSYPGSNHNCAAGEVECYCNDIFSGCMSESGCTTYLTNNCF